MAIDQGTELGGFRRDFPSTCWSRFAGTIPGDPAGRRQAAEELSRRYWKPIYAYIRARWAKTNEDAKDLTQDFFVWMMEGDFVGRADPSRGRFRAYVKVALQHYLSDEQRRQGRQKRGGDREILFFSGAPESAGLPDPQGRSPEQALDDEWRRELLLNAERALEETLKKENREVSFRIFRDYYLSGAEDLIYREVAAKYGIAESDVFNHLKYAKKRFRSILADLVLETVSGESDLADEVREMFGDEPA